MTTTVFADHVPTTGSFLSPGTIPAELQLLLRLVQPHLEPAQLEQIRWLHPDNLDWPYFLALADFHHLAPLLYQHLSTLKLACVPDEALAVLHGAYLANAQHSVRLSAELVRLVQLFQAAGVPVLSFKGPLLAQQAYGNLVLRQFLDLDLLIPPAAFVPARALLEAEGYDPQYALSPARQARYLQTGYEMSFWHRQHGLKLDLHWSLLPKGFSFTPPAALSWEQPDQVRLFGQAIPTLRPEKLLLFLCAHGAKHNWLGLNWICDIAALVGNQPQLDWPWLETHRGPLATGRMLDLGLYLAQHLLGLNLPPLVQGWLAADPTLAALAGQVEQALWAVKEAPRPTRGPVSASWFRGGWPWQSYQAHLSGWYGRDRVYRACLETRANRWRHWYAETVQPTPLEWQSLALPAPFSFLYYPFRPARLVWRYLLKKSPNC